MFEFGLGVILAALFVAAYLLITAYFRRDGHELGGLRHAVSLNPVDSSRALDERRSRNALTSGDTSRRESDSDRDGAAEETDSKR